MTNRQFSLHSGFGPSTTAREALAGTKLEGRVAIVTGGYSGIGLETTRVLAEAGATVIVPVRSAEKAREALAGLGAAVRVESSALDLMDPSSIQQFADAFLRSRRPLHLLVNSAGIMANPLVRDARGYESQFSTNHLGHFELTARLWPALRAAEGARVVTVSSRAHRICGVDFEDPNFERRAYDRWQSYAQSKTANVLFALALDARGESHGIRSFSVHPGTILTDLARHLTPEEIAAFDTHDENGNLRIDPVRGLRTVEQGAATSVWCATSPQLNGTGGVYCEDCDIAAVGSAGELRDPGVRPWAVDPELAERLWGLSERLTGVEFPLC